MSALRTDRHTRTLLLVGAALLVLLAATVGATFLPASPLVRGTISFAIAIAKAALIFWFFMHGREMTGIVRLAAVAACVFIVIMLALTRADYAMRHQADDATFGAEPTRNRTPDAGLPS